MTIVEHMIQTIAQGRQAELEELDKEYNAIESELGFPAKKRLWAMSGAHNHGTLIIQREWPSLAAMEETFNKSWDHPGIQALNEKGTGIVLNSRTELFMLAE